MPERRGEQRAGSSDRRDILRPPLWLNILLLFIAAAVSLFAARQRRTIDAEFTRTFSKSYAGPSELNSITAELAEMDLAKGALDKELESRMAYIGSLKALDFYLSIDTAKKTFIMKSGNEIVRETSVQIAPAFGKGAFAVSGKKFSGAEFTIFLSNGRVIQSPSVKNGPPMGAKPGSFIVPKADLQAIWDQITPETRVYVF